MAPTSQIEAPGNATSVTLSPLSSSTTYTIRVTRLYPGGGSSTTTGRLTTRESSGAAGVQSGPSPRRMGMWAQPPHGKWGSPQPPSVTRASKTSLTGSEALLMSHPRGRRRPCRPACLPALFQGKSPARASCP